MPIIHNLFQHKSTENSFIASWWYMAH